MRSGFVIHAFGPAIKIRFKKIGMVGHLPLPWPRIRDLPLTMGLSALEARGQIGAAEKISAKFIDKTRGCKLKPPETTLIFILPVFGIAFELCQHGQ